MAILVVLRTYGELESEAAKLYAGFAAQFQHDDKARDFFIKLAEDEKAHFDLVKYQERVVRKAPKDFAPVDVDMPAIEKTISAIAAFRKTSPALKDAIRFALDIETEIVEHYTGTVMKESNKGFAQLMQGLTANAKDDHYKELIKFAAARA